MSSAKALGSLLGDWLTYSECEDIEVNGLTIDSREVAAGDLFFAYPGTSADGRDYINQAVARGASVVVCEAGRPIPENMQVPVIQLTGLQGKVGIIAERFYDNPGRDLFIVGITGTNGKTSCAHLLVQAFNALGVSSGLIGTLGWGFLQGLRKNLLTTPDPVSLHRMLDELRGLGATHVCMEVSSHALAQGRVAGVPFDVALFTNLTHDHLDYHDNLDDYARAKARLFESPTLRFAIINQDDEFGDQLAKSLPVRVWTYGLNSGDIRAAKIEAGVDGLAMALETEAGIFETQVKLIGRINAHNILAVAATLLADGCSGSTVAEVLGRLSPVPGRMELFQQERNRTPFVVVDYAHTPDALERALSSVREHCAGHIWCVFGCGGDRDRAKRPLMGAIVERLADEIIVTDDNPRHELPETITNEIVAGMGRSPRVMNDRVRAIQYAIGRAAPADWVLIAGKGHETTQQIGNLYQTMDDRSIVSDCLGVAA